MKTFSVRPVVFSLECLASADISSTFTMLRGFATILAVAFSSLAHADLHEHFDVGLHGISHVGKEREWQTLAYFRVSVFGEEALDGDWDEQTPGSDFTWGELMVRASQELDYLEFWLKPERGVTEDGLASGSMASYYFRRDTAIDLEILGSFSLMDVTIIGKKQIDEGLVLAKIWLDWLSIGWSRSAAENSDAIGWHGGVGAAVAYSIPERLRVSIGAQMRGVVGLNKETSRQISSNGDVTEQSDRPVHWIREFFVQAEYSINDWVSLYAELTDTRFAVRDDNVSSAQESEDVQRAITGLRIQLGEKAVHRRYPMLEEYSLR